MTATLPAPAPAAGTGTSPARTAAHRAPRPVRRGHRALLHTPGKLWALGIGLVLLSLAWGGFGGWVADQHSSAADSLATRNERLTLDSRQLYQSIADADATITAAFLATPTPPLKQQRRFAADLATAHANLSGLQAAEGTSAMGGALASLGAGLSAYNGYVGEATSEYADGHSLTGGSFLEDASEVAHLTLLPAANTVFTRENDALDAANAQAAGLPTMIGLVLLAVLTGLVLYTAQRWLYRRTNRLLSPPLALASLILFASVIWLLAAFFGARSDFGRGIDHGSAPAQSLALASIGVQQIRGDAVLNVISRSGNTSFSDDFAKTSKQVDAWLGDAGAAQGADGGGPALVAAAKRDAGAWYAANGQVYRLGMNGNYAGERGLVISGTNGNTVTGYNHLEGDLSAAIAADQAVFSAAAASGAAALDPLTGGIVAGSVLMALCCGLAISRRLAEYR